MPTVHMDENKIKILMVCESYPENMSDYFYNSEDSMFTNNILRAFSNAKIPVKSRDDLYKYGFYITVVVKERRNSAFPIPASIVQGYSFQLEKEIASLTNLKAIILMGDTAIKAMNYISKRILNTRSIPIGSTYKIRTGKYYFGKIRVFPSYLPTGKNFLIEKSKQEMVTEDIKQAYALIK